MKVLYNKIGYKERNLITIRRWCDNWVKNKYQSQGLYCVKSVVFKVILVRMRENADQNNSEYGHFLRSALLCLISGI